MTYDEMIAVIQAAKEGKQIQYFHFGEWRDHIDPQFNFGGWKYRIRPKPRTLYAVYSPKFDTFTAYSDDREKLMLEWMTSGKIVEFVEVIKEN